MMALMQPGAGIKNAVEACCVNLVIPSKFFVETVHVIALVAVHGFVNLIYISFISNLKSGLFFTYLQEQLQIFLSSTVNFGNLCDTC